MYFVMCKTGDSGVARVCICVELVTNGYLKARE
jgi:hypothetical protein